MPKRQLWLHQFGISFSCVTWKLIFSNYNCLKIIIELVFFIRGLKNTALCRNRRRTLCHLRNVCVRNVSQLQVLWCSWSLLVCIMFFMQFSSLLRASDVPVPTFCVPAPIRSFGTSKFLSAGKSRATIHIGLKEVGYVKACYAVILQMKIYIRGWNPPTWGQPWHWG